MHIIITIQKSTTDKFVYVYSLLLKKLQGSVLGMKPRIIVSYTDFLTVHSTTKIKKISNKSFSFQVNMKGKQVKEEEPPILSEWKKFPIPVRNLVGIFYYLLRTYF